MARLSLLDRPAARRFAALQEHRAPDDRAFLLEEEEQELPAAPFDVDDVVALLQVAQDGRLVFYKRRSRGEPGTKHGSRKYSNRGISPHTTPVKPITAGMSANIGPEQD